MIIKSNQKDKFRRKHIVKVTLKKNTYDEGYIILPLSITNYSLHEFQELVLIFRIFIFEKLLYDNSNFPYIFPFYFRESHLCIWCESMA